MFSKNEKLRYLEVKNAIDDYVFKNKFTLNDFPQSTHHKASSKLNIKS